MNQTTFIHSDKRLLRHDIRTAPANLSPLRLYNDFKDLVLKLDPWLVDDLLDYDDESSVTSLDFSAINTFFEHDKILPSYLADDFELMMYPYENTCTNPHEVCSSADLAKSLIGLHTLPNGFTFVGFQYGQDSSVAAFSILYHDGTKLRLYTPRYGNHINIHLNTVLGCEDMILETAPSNIVDEVSLEAVFQFGPYFTTLYKNIYNVSDSNPYLYTFNWDALLMDIESAIKII